MIDIGANLIDKSFAHDLDEVMARAKGAGVLQMVVTGSQVDISVGALELARTHPGVLYATAGVHPHHAKDIDDAALVKLRELLSHEEVVAVGECGLDYNRDFSPRDKQRAAFEAHLELASEVGKPLFLHERDAAEDMISILSKHRSSFDKAVVHCFTGDEKTLRTYLDLDLYIGITGWICDERRGMHLRDLVRLIPEERLMIETDAPYLLPRTIRPKPKSRRCEPAHLPYVVQTLADALGKDSAEVAADTQKTAQEFFGISPT